MELRVRELERKYNNLSKEEKSININGEKFKNIKFFYSEKKLKQLNFLREEIGKKYKKLSQIDNFILAISLGIAYG